MAISKITTKGIADDAVTSAKLAPGAVTVNDIPDNEITDVKLSNTLDLSAKTLTLPTISALETSGNLIVGGNLTVNGTTTTINSTTLEVDDKNVILSAGSPNAAGSDGAGITVDNGSDTDATILYSGTNDAWHINKNLGLNFSNPQTNIHVIGTSTDPNVGIILQSHDTPSATSTLSLYARDASNVNQAVNIQNTLGNLYIDSNVGIGTTTPDALLHVSDTSPHIDIGPQGGNRGKIGYHDLDVIIGSTSGTGEIIFKNNIGSTDSPQTSGDTKMVIHDVGMTIYSDTYNILNVATDTNDDQTSTDGIIKITNGSSYTTKAEFRWDESEDLVHVSYGDHGRHISIDSSGNVGIGTGSTSPSTTLEVAGTAKADQYLLDAIDATISDTAVDVFVYDTRKDSDGGAWRKRTQHTSWYNETLNTATRGSRREFPAVAVIVAHDNQVTIYDGDDPDLPMWMVFLGGGNTSWMAGGTDFCLAAFNGILCAGGKSTNQRLRVVEFVHDGNLDYATTSTGALRSSGQPVSQRNSTYGFTITLDSSIGIVERTINDVAMTVLPNAPIDSATGLPVPTIAVATGLGTSIIRDDGTVVDYTLGNYTIVNVDFDYDNNVLQSSRNIGSSGGALYVNKYPILSADNSGGTIQQELILSSTAGDNTSGLDFIRTPFNEGTKNVVGMKDSTLAFSSDAGAVQGIGVYQLGPDGTTKTTTLGAVISSDYNTGWMNGDIKLATLSDTDDTDVTGSELVTGDNSTFTSSIGDWFDPFYGTTPNNSGGYLTFNSTGSYMQARLAISSALTVGKTYMLSFDNIAGIGVNFYATVEGTTITVTTAGVYTLTFVASSTTLQIDFKRAATSGTCQVDNVSVRLAEEDRSVNGNGLQVFGTVTKANVATNTDLKYYSNWSLSNYLYQPYNADLNFTSEMSIMFWAKNWQQGHDLLHRGPADTRNSATSFLLYCDAGYDYRFTLSNNGSNEYNTEIQLDGNLSGWQFVCFKFQRPTVTAFLNGELKTTNSEVDFDIFSQATDQNGLYIGLGPIGTSDSSLQLALLRISATAPSPEQIKKIYEDEKVLFQENAQATLYGSSDAVTALAYDDSTELLHVGTSSGRSVFQGLKRIDNTTDAVGSAISASNGLVAED